MSKNSFGHIWDHRLGRKRPSKDFEEQGFLVAGEGLSLDILALPVSSAAITAMYLLASVTPFMD